MKKVKITALSYDDVLLKPQYSAIRSRQDVSIKTRLTKNIELSIPVVSANMDTVTEHKMAITMARLGGVGVIHRFLSPVKQASEVKKVKRADSFIIDNPYTVNFDNTLAEVKIWSKEKGVSSWLVIDKDNKLIGILTRRDVI